MSLQALTFFVNGQKVIENNPNPELNLLQYLREILLLHGTKNGCSSGVCGSCTVMLSHFNHQEKKIIHRAVTACLVPLCAIHGMAVTTVEGIGSTLKGLHPVQERLAKSHGTQCGFCSPGMVMSMYALLRDNPKPTQHEIEVALEGNLCRCTGYRPILDAYRTFSKEFQCELGENCCRNQEEPRQRNNNAEDSLSGFSCEFAVYEPSQDVIFPSELQLTQKYDTDPLVFHGTQVTWFRPTSLTSLLELKTKYPEAVMIVGNTDIGLKVKFSNKLFPVMIAATHIPELRECKVTDEGVHVGASVTFSALEKLLKTIVESKPAWQTGVLVSLLEALRWFVTFHTRNVASLGGNIVAGTTESFAPLLMAAGCELTIVAKDCEPRVLKLDQSFYKAAQTSILQPKEVLQSIYIPLSCKHEYYHAFRHSNRRANSRAFVNAGMCVKFNEGSIMVKEMSMSFGGVSKTVVTATNTMQELVGRAWDNTLVEDGCFLLAKELPLATVTSDGKEDYRLGLAQNFFFKFYALVAMEMQDRNPSVNLQVGADLTVEMLTSSQRGVSEGTHVFEQPTSGQPLHDAVGRPLRHAGADLHVSGEAQYVDDIPSIAGELFAAPVLSTKAHARILEVDTTEALAVPGVIDYVSHKDVPGINGIVLDGMETDEEVFAADKVVCQGQLIGLILAKSKTTAKQASRLIQVKYEELTPIITIEQAIKAESFFPNTFTKDVNFGNLEAGFAASTHVIEGEVSIGSQEHFYMEPNVALVVPRDIGEMDVYGSLHDPTGCQEKMMKVLDIPSNKITMHVKRLGGSFGGKETRSVLVLLPAAVAAYKWRCPVRFLLDREEDLKMTGGRHPFFAKYKVGVTDEGHLVALDLALYTNVGCSQDVSPFVLGCVMFGISMTYRIPNLHVEGHLCKTNLPSNSSVRGFGNPQRQFIIENILTQVSEQLNISCEKVRQINMLKFSDPTAFNYKTDQNLQRCFEEVMAKSALHHRKQLVEEFNRRNRWRKRGLAITPVVFGIGLPVAFLNQGAALVHIYKDGSVLLSHGGVEMGQGIHTKMIQIASRALEIPVEKIHISECNTSAVPNSVAVQASCGSDIHGNAVLDACQTLKVRLQPYVEADPQGGWEKWVMAAFFDRVSLSSTGFGKTPGADYDAATNSGTLHNYYTYGAAVSEVEIECLTGAHVFLRTDIVMDVGTSLNPAIDIGQIEGAFLQGYGLHTMEEREFSGDGVLESSANRYKIPTLNDIPLQFNVSLLKGSSNPRAVYSSKGVGEPSLLLGVSVLFAIRSAIAAAREEVGLTGWFRFDSPATSENIFKACGSQIGKLAK